jgi:hypothetical protein
MSAKQLREGVLNVLALLQRLDAPHLAMLGGLIPYGEGGDLPIDRLLTVVGATSDEQFEGVLQLQQAFDADNAQEVRERQTLSEQLCNELACSAKELLAFGPLLQLRELCEMLAQLDELLLMALYEAIPDAAPQHQRQMVLQLQEFFGNHIFFVVLVRCRLSSCAVDGVCRLPVLALVIIE